MNDAAEMTERHATILAELAEIGMVIVRGLRDQVEAGETPEARARAAVAYPKIARAVRQTLALEARLRRDAGREAVETEDRVNREIVGHIRRRKAQVRMWMQRAICEETPDDIEAAEERLHDLYERLDDQVLDEDFALAPFTQVITHLHRELGLTPPDFEAADEDDNQDEDDPGEDGGDQIASPPPESPRFAPDARDSSA